MVTSLILYFTISHVISFTCSLFESVLLSCTPAYIALLKKKGAPSGGVLEEFKSHIDKPLAAILTLNTFAHTFGAAGVGASVLALFGDKWVAVGSVVLTLTMLYWTEMLPKTLGALYWKQFAPFFVKPIQLLIYITYPFVASFNTFAKLISRGKKHDRITEDEIRIALERGAKAGVIEETEQEMVENIFRLGDRSVGVLMIPRVDIEWIDINDPIDEIREKILTLKFERYLLCDGDIDQVIGILKGADLLETIWLGKTLDLKKIAILPLFVQENVQTFELMELFKQSNSQIGVVTDEYGVIQGVITMEEIMNAIMKDIDQEGISQIFRVNNRSWFLDGKMPIDEFKEIFNYDILPDEEKARYRTLSGLCMHQLGSIPCKGDRFIIGEYRFEIVRVKKRRVEKILLTKRTV
ncbi:MAG: hypothetical protein S4CHLAM45_11990 [Chlamydiales bacterium]|nr:hypothetical protein [Chlamydiales bacterium]MCH9619688.1 hypothetical protein [Chlamydiales bacterium]MCH9623294.1 hypothetical protein [Chlamydiales bacterium]